jgi:hypothetical protein
MWFAAFQSYQHNPWIVHLAAKMLVNDNDTLSLIAYNPFELKAPPKWVRAEHYRYVFTQIGSNSTASTKAWWKRKHIGSYLPPVSLRSLRDYINEMGWTIPQIEAV